MEGFAVGARVRVQGLVGAPQHNGNFGVVTELLSDAGRVRVMLDNKSDISVKPANLVMVPVSSMPISISKFINPALIANLAAEVAAARGPGNKGSLDFSNRQISNLDGVERLVGLEVLHLDKNQIVSLDGVRFPDSLKTLNLTENKITSLEGVIFPDRLETLVLSENPIVSFGGVQFPNSLKKLYCAYIPMVSLEGVVFPDGLEELHYTHNPITSLQGVVFPDSLQKLDLYDNQLVSLEGAVFPPNLQVLNLNGNKIVSIERAVFPDNLQKLTLNRNKIDTLTNARLPAQLKDFELLDNLPIKTCKHFKIPPGIIDFRISNASTNCGEITSKLLRSQDRKVETMLGDPEALRAHMANLGSRIPQGLTREDASRMLQIARASAEAPKKCRHCGGEAALGKKLKTCAGCNSESYCSVDCQQADWERHKPECKFRQQQKASSSAGASGAFAAEGGNKSKTRRRQQRRRQSKRNKMQRKYKYSRRRRNAKSKSKHSKRL